MTEQEARTILRALDVLHVHVDNDPEYAPDERAEWGEKIGDARRSVLAEHPGRNANTVMRLKSAGLDPDSMTAREVVEAGAALDDEPPVGP